MRFLKIAVIAGLSYVGLVIAFESMIGVFQPTTGDTLVITTFDADGGEHERVVSRLDHAGQLYVAANHWPRAWYGRALENPDVEVTLEDAKSAHRAVPVTGEERDRVEAAHSLPAAFRFVTGYPPRHFLRLDPRDGSR